MLNWLGKDYWVFKTSTNRHNVSQRSQKFIQIVQIFLSKFQNVDYRMVIVEQVSISPAFCTQAFFAAFLSLCCIFLVDIILAQKLNIKCWWNWLQVSISTKFYKQLFHTKVFCSAFLYLQFGFVIIFWKNIGAKVAHKMLVKLTTDWGRSVQQRSSDECSCQGNRQDCHSRTDSKEWIDEK